ncbi:MAG: hypothetical protein NZM26_02360 [Patescibacteria group bacterium]|nr:hypothetical protein [Patescibacteria group bacterium]
MLNKGLEKQGFPRVNKTRVSAHASKSAVIAKNPKPPYSGA